MLPAFRSFLPPCPVAVAARCSHDLSISVLSTKRLGCAQKPQVLGFHYLLRQHRKFCQPHYLPPIRNGKQEGTCVGLYRHGYVYYTSFSIRFCSYLLTNLCYFIDSANLPSKTQLLMLDFLIIFLQLVLLCIAYETSLSLVLPPETLDPLSPVENSSSGICISFLTMKAIEIMY